MLHRTMLLHAFRTRGGYYVYDGCSNNIIEVDQPIHDLVLRSEGTPSDALGDREGSKGRLSGCGCVHPDSLSQVAPGLGEWIGHHLAAGVLCENPSREIRHPSDRYYDDLLASAVEQLVLQVTRDCNLACAYCPYATQSNSYRDHEQSDMPEDTALRAINYYIRHSADTEDLVVSFYGGEPLLNLDLIRKCVTYLDRAGEGRGIRYSITTNGTMLTGPVLDFLSARKVNLLISLDGPKDEHDRNRQWPDGSGTFELVARSLETLLRVYPAYCRNHVGLNVVMDPIGDFAAVAEYFGRDFEVEHLSSFVLSSMDWRACPDRVPRGFVPSLANARELQQELLRVLWPMSKGHMEPNGSRVGWTIVNSAVVRHTPMLGGPVLARGPTYHPSGPCVPGVRRMFVTVDGDILPCERVNERNRDFVIGNIDDGIDVQQARRLLNIGRGTAQQCLACWAGNLCYLCPTYSDGEHRIDDSLRMALCGEVRTRADRSLREYMSYVEVGVVA